MSNQFSTRRIKPMRTKDDLNKRELLNTSGATIAKHSMLRIVSTKHDGAYHECAKAIADGTQPTTALLFGWHDVDDQVLVIASESYLFTMDTSTGALGDPVYLSDTTAGALTLSVTSEQVGWVQYIGNATAGLVWISIEARGSGVGATLNGYRPDVDLAWESTIISGDGDVHVDGTAGSDSTGDGTPAKPYLTIGTAILDIPHNRSAAAHRNVTVKLDAAGSLYDIPANLEAVSLITIEGTLPTAAQSGTVSSDFGNRATVEESIIIKTSIAFVGIDDYKGYLIKYLSGKYGWVSKSVDVGGFVQLTATQNVNGATGYDTINTGDAFDLYSPDDMSVVRSTDVDSGGTNFSQMDEFTISLCKLSSVSTEGKLVFYQSRATLQDCHVGPDIERLYVSNGELTLDNCYVETEGALQEFGMVGAGSQSVLRVKGGTVFEGTTATSTNNWPIAASDGARVLFAGPARFRNCRGISLVNGAEIDYDGGYNANVTLLWGDHQAGQPLVEATLLDSGVPVRGTIPDCHGDTLDVGSITVYAKAPAQLWMGQGSSILVTGKSGGYNFTLTDGADYTSGNSYDDSFIRMNRVRAFTTQGETWAPFVYAPTGGTQNIALDWSNGPSQVVDLSDASNNAATMTWLFPSNGELGDWATLELIHATGVSHVWHAAFVWASGSAPTLSQVSGEKDFLRFYYNGVDWIGEHVADVNLGTGIDLLSTGGAVTSYPTIGAALAVAASGEVVRVGPGTYAESVTIPAGVRLVGHPAAQAVILAGADTTSVRVTFADSATLREFTVVAPSSGGNAAIDCTGLGAAELAVLNTVVVLGDGGTGHLIEGAGAGAVVLLDVYHNGGTTTGNVLEVSSGECIIDSLTCNAGTALSAISCANATLSGVTLQFGPTWSGTNKLLLGANSEVSLAAAPQRPGTAPYTNGVHITAGPVVLDLEAVSIRSTTIDFLVDPAVSGTGSTMRWNGVDARQETFSSDSTWNASVDVLIMYLDDGVENDKVVRVGGGLSVGATTNTASSDFGAGSPVVNGMAVFSDDGTGTAFIDNTTAAASRSGSTFNIFQTLAANEECYIGGDFPFTDIPFDLTAAITSGVITADVSDGAAGWISVNLMEHDGTSPYAQRANDIFTEVGSEFLILGDTTGWGTDAVDGTTKYWLRLTVSTLLSGVPTAQRFRLGRDRTGISSDGHPMYFGVADVTHTFWEGTGQNLSAPSGGANSPNTAGLTISTNISYNQLFTRYTNGAARRAGTQIEVPVGVDTSKPFCLTTLWTTTGTSTTAMRWQAYVAAVVEGAVIGALTEISVTKDVAPAGVAGTVVKTRFEFDLPSVVPGDELAFMLWRQGTVDTNTDDADVLTLAWEASFWS